MKMIEREEYLRKLIARLDDDRKKEGTCPRLFFAEAVLKGTVKE